MKKFLMMAIVFIMAVAFSSCGSDQANGSQAGSDSSSKTEFDGGKEGDKSQSESNIDYTEKNKDINAAKVEKNDVMKDARAEVKLKDVKITKEVMPKERPVGYSFYVAGNGQVYVYADVEVKNLKNDPLQGDQIMAVIIDDGMNQYKGFAVFQDPDRGFSYGGTASVASGDSQDVAFLVECPTSIQKVKDLKIIFQLEGKKFEYTVE